MINLLVRLKKYSFVLPLLYILGLAYCRYTYILNPNWSGKPLFLEIQTIGKNIGPDSITNMMSILIYWMLFFLGNIGLFALLFSSFEKVKAAGFFYLLLSGGSILFFALDAFIIESKAITGLATTLKNFTLSPLFTGFAYIVIEYFHWYGKPS